MTLAIQPSFRTTSYKPAIKVEILKNPPNKRQMYMVVS